MIGRRARTSWGACGTRTAALLLVLAALAGCAEGNRPEEQAVAPQAAPPPPPPPAPPPVNLAGRWKLSAEGGGACFVNFASPAGAIQGTIAPEGGCPGNFFTSRKWTFEHGMLIVRDHKGEPLAQFAVGGDRLDGQATTGKRVSLSR
jgi:protease inhibitor Inh